MTTVSSVLTRSSHVNLGAENPTGSGGIGGGERISRKERRRAGREEWRDREPKG